MGRLSGPRNRIRQAGLRGAIDEALAGSAESAMSAATLIDLRIVLEARVGPLTQTAILAAERARPVLCVGNDFPHIGSAVVPLCESRP